MQMLLFELLQHTFTLCGYLHTICAYLEVVKVTFPEHFQQEYQTVLAGITV